MYAGECLRRPTALSLLADWTRLDRLGCAAGPGLVSSRPAIGVLGASEELPALDGTIRSERLLCQVTVNMCAGLNMHVNHDVNTTYANV